MEKRELLLTVCRIVKGVDIQRNPPGWGVEGVDEPVQKPFFQL